MSKLSRGALELESTSIRFDDLLAKAYSKSCSAAAEAGMRLAWPTSPPSLQVLVDVNRFQRVLSSLLSNAFKYSPPGAMVTVSAVAVSGTVEVSVRDHGPGIPEAFRTKVFDRFTMANDSDTREPKKGYGRGLALARQFMFAMGGRIRFETKSGEGTTFTVSLIASD